MNVGNFGLHKLANAELERLLRALHRGALVSPITRSDLIEKAFGHIEGHLDLVVGRDVAAAKALVIAVLSERAAQKAREGKPVFGGLAVPGEALTFELATATRVVFGAGKIDVVPGFLAEIGVTRVLAVTGARADRGASLWDALTARGVVVTTFSVVAEPTVDVARAGVEAARTAGAEAVIALGGGSVIDAGKAIAALAANGGDPLDYLEVVGRGAPLTQPPLPFVAIPTTAGTGAEVTRNAVLGSPEHGVKASLRSPLMLPRLAVVDPDFLAGAPAEVLRASGLDALSQLIEPFVSVRANPLADALAREGLSRSRRSLKRAVLGAAGDQEREDLALASLFGGLCLANSGLGAVHGFAAPLGGMFHAPHGAVCAALLPHVMAVNLRALTQRDPHGTILPRYTELARVLTGEPSAVALDGVKWVTTLCRDLEVPGLSAYGMSEADVGPLIEKAARASSMKGNSILLSPDELEEIARLSI
ncbi:MAG: iron-containing alcohol dehydrogenase [Polyangiales bacterium]